jgi:hypothetical protein
VDGWMNGWMKLVSLLSTISGRYSEVLENKKEVMVVRRSTGRRRVGHEMIID